MEDHTRRGLPEKDLEELLNQSDFECDDDEDDFRMAEDMEYLYSASSSSSEEEDLHEELQEVIEMIIPFSGACGLKQYCHGKPNPIGIKIFVLASPNGTVCDMLTYQGKTTFPEDISSNFGLGECAILYLTRTLVPGHILYYDRYFSTIKLAQELNNRGFKCAGTLMKNRIPSELRNKIENDKTLKAKGRGSFQVLVQDDNSMAFTKWYDNKPVLLLSTIHAANPVDECRRWCKSTKCYVTIKRPQVIREYNANMGGVDLADRMLAVCPSRSRTKKWTIRLIFHMIDLAVTNPWTKFEGDQLERKVPRKKIKQLRQFKMDMGEYLIEEFSHDAISDQEIDYQTENRKRGRPASVSIPSKIRRQHGTHLPDIDGEKQHRCREAGCTKKTTVRCVTCDLFLCLTSNRNCFKNFHEKN